MKKSFLPLCLIFALLQTTGCGKDAPPGKPPIGGGMRDKVGTESTNPSAAQPAATKAPMPDLAKTKPEQVFTAQEFYDQFKFSQESSKKYAGKVLEVSGVIALVGRNLQKDAFIYLKIENDPLGVGCFTAAPQPWSQFSKGQKVTIRGLRREDAFGASLSSCIVVEKDPTPAIAITAEALEKEYADQFQETIKKYDKKTMIITGVVEKTELDKYQHLTITMKTTGKVRILCHVKADDKDLLESTNPGHELTLSGIFEYNDKPENAGISSCLAVKK